MDVHLNMIQRPHGSMCFLHSDYLIWRKHGPEELSATFFFDVCCKLADLCYESVYHYRWMIEMVSDSVAPHKGKRL